MMVKSSIKIDSSSPEQRVLSTIMVNESISFDDLNIQTGLSGPSLAEILAKLIDENKVDFEIEVIYPKHVSDYRT